MRDRESGPGTLLRDDHGRLVVRLFFVYMVRVAKVLETEIRMALQDTLEPVLDPEMAAIFEQYEAGERQGQRKMLKRLLGQRFGVLSPHAVARIDGSSVGELELMELRVLTAPTLDEVLGHPVDQTS